MKVTKLTQKEKYKKIRDLGLSSAQARKISKYGEARFHKEYNRIRKNYRAHERIEKKKTILKNAGFDEKTANSYSKRSYSFINEYIKNYSDVQLIIFFRDASEEMSNETFYEYKSAMKRQSRKQSIAGLMEMLSTHNMQTISIGKPIAILSDNPDADSRYYMKSDYAIAYKGKCVNLSPLLSALDLVVALIYELNDRYMFIMSVIDLMRRMPYPEAQKNAGIIEKTLLTNESYLEDDEIYDRTYNQI